MSFIPFRLSPITDRPDRRDTMSMLALALLTPDRPHNLGAALRLGACLAVPVHVVEPAGFPLDDRRIREAALDYGGGVELIRHVDTGAFLARVAEERHRLVLLTTRGSTAFQDLRYEPGDIVTVGSEGAGAPEEIHAAAALRVRIPMAAGRRSLNLVTAATLVLGEAMRQTGAFAKLA